MVYGFLNLRGRNESEGSRWREFVDDNIVMMMPLTEYRSTRSHERVSHPVGGGGGDGGGLDPARRIVRGIEGVITDTMSLHVMLNLIVNRIRAVGGRVQARYGRASERSCTNTRVASCRYAPTDICVEVSACRYRLLLTNSSPTPQQVHPRHKRTQRQRAGSSSCGQRWVPREW